MDKPSDLPNPCRIHDTRIHCASPTMMSASQQVGKRGLPAGAGRGWV
jgi:hypothetical protein